MTVIVYHLSLLTNARNVDLGLPECHKKGHPSADYCFPILELATQPILLPFPDKVYAPSIGLSNSSKVCALVLDVYRGCDRYLPCRAIPSHAAQNTINGEPAEGKHTSRIIRNPFRLPPLIQESTRA